MPSGRVQTVGRFAPSPTGDLHFGSLVAALGSWLSVRHQGGAWRVRVEDIDPPREVPGSAARILADLAAFDLHPDGPVLYQSSRRAAHEDAIASLLRAGQAYPCACSRADLPDDGVYPGTCREGLPPGARARSIRVRVDARPVRFEDGVHGAQSWRLDQACGDFVIRRADGLPAYQLAVTVDDAYQQVSEVVRGTDLLESTPRQIHLQRLLGYPQPAYLHLPLAVDAEGRKLGKRLKSDPLVRHAPAHTLVQALRFLGHDAPDLVDTAAVLDWGTRNWNPALVPRTPAPAVADAP